MAIDHRRLNMVSLRQKPVNLLRIPDCLSGSVWFSKLDVQAAYNQILIKPADRYKTAFSTCKGQFQYKRLSVPAVFCRLAQTLLKGLSFSRTLSFLDEVILPAWSTDYMLESLDLVVSRFQEAHIKMKPSKCVSFAQEIEFLGQIINTQGK